MESAVQANRDERSDEASGKTFSVFFLVRRGLPEVFNAAFPRKIKKLKEYIRESRSHSFS